MFTGYVSSPSDLKQFTYVWGYIRVSSTLVYNSFTYYILSPYNRDTRLGRNGLYDGDRGGVRGQEIRLVEGR